MLERPLHRDVFRPLLGEQVSGLSVGGAGRGVLLVFTDVDGEEHVVTFTDGDGLDWLATERGEEWSPARLFAAGEQGAFFDPSDRSTLWQDAAGTIPVTGDGDPVGLIRDKSGRGNHVTQAVATQRPIYRTDGTRHWLRFDGVDDYLASDTFTWGSGEVTGVTGGEATSLIEVFAGVYGYCSTNTYSYATPGSFELLLPYNKSADRVGARSRGASAARDAYFPGAATLGACVLTQLGRAPSPSKSDVRLDGVLQAADGVNQGARDYGPYPLMFGAMTGSPPKSLSGDIYGCVLINLLLNADDLALCERWMAAKTGVAI